MIFRLILVSFLLLHILNSELEGSTAPPIIKFETNDVEITDTGKKLLNHLNEEIIQDSEFYKERIEDGNRVFWFRSVHSKEQLENKPCLLLERARKLEEILIEEKKLKKSDFIISIESYYFKRTQDLSNQGFAVQFNSKWRKSEIQLPYGYVRFNDSDFTDKIKEIGREIRCEYELYEKHIIEVTPFLSKEEFTDEPCRNFEDYQALKQNLRVNYNLDNDIKFRFNDIKYGYESESDSSGFKFEVLERY